MARDAAYREAEEKIEEARRSGATELDLVHMTLTELPELLGYLPRLQSLDLSDVARNLVLVGINIGGRHAIEYGTVFLRAETRGDRTEPPSRRKRQLPRDSAALEVGADLFRSTLQLLSVTQCMGYLRSPNLVTHFILRRAHAQPPDRSNCTRNRAISMPRHS